MGETDIRSTVVVPILEHIGQTRPRGVVLENVRGFMWTKHEKIRESILNALRSFGYKVHVQLLNSRDFKVPQIRERVYIVAIRGDIKAPAFQFPEPQGEPYSLSKFLDKGIVPRMSDLTRRRVADTTLAIKTADGVNPLKSDQRYIVDTHCGRGPSWQCNVCPTITRSREGGMSFLDCKSFRYLSVESFIRLQGSCPKTFDFSMISKRQAGQLAGNAMTVSVVKALLPNLLAAIGMPQ